MDKQNRQSESQAANKLPAKPSATAPSTPAQAQMVAQPAAQLTRNSRALAGAAAAMQSAAAQRNQLAAHLAHVQQAAAEAARNLAAAQAHAAELQQQQEAARLQAQEGRARKAQAQEAKQQAAYAQKLREVTAAVAEALAERAQEEAAQRAAQQATQQSGQLDQPGSGQAVDPASTSTPRPGTPSASTPAGEGTSGNTPASQSLQQQPTAAAVHNTASPSQANASGLQQMPTPQQQTLLQGHLQQETVQPQAAAADVAGAAAVPDTPSSSDAGDIAWMYNTMQGAPATPGGGLLAAWRVWFLYRNAHRQRRGSAPASQK